MHIISIAPPVLWAEEKASESIVNWLRGRCLSPVPFHATCLAVGGFCIILDKFSRFKHGRSRGQLQRLWSGCGITGDLTELPPETNTFQCYCNCVSKRMSAGCDPEAQTGKKTYKETAAGSFSQDGDRRPPAAPRQPQFPSKADHHQEVRLRGTPAASPRLFTLTAVAQAPEEYHPGTHSCICHRASMAGLLSFLPAGDEEERLRPTTSIKAERSERERRRRAGRRVG